MSIRAFSFGLIFFLACLGGMSRAGNAQRLPQLTAALASAEQSHWEVRLALASGDSIQGHIAEFTDSTATIANRDVPIASIMRIRRRSVHQDGIIHGTIAGGLAGLVVGGVVGLRLCRVSDSCSTSLRVRTLAGTTLVGAFVGAAVGGIVRPGKVTWPLVWAR